MKKLTILIGILVASNIVLAQDKSFEHRKEEMKDWLELTEDQTNQLQELHKKYKPEFMNIRNDASLSKSEKMRSAADLIDEKDEELKSILSNEQYGKLELIKKVRASDRKKLRQRMRQRMRNRRN